MKKNILFIWIPKTGGHTIHRLFEDFEGMERILEDFEEFKNEGNVTFGHASILELIRQGHVSQEWFDNAYKVTFVRDPYTRLVSLWLYLMRIGHTVLGTPFYQFVDSIVDNPPNIGAYNVQGLSQAACQCDSMRGIKFDFVGRYENYHEDVKKLMSLLGHDVKVLPWINANPNKKENYMNAYDPSTIEKVKAFYKKDFEILNYQK